MIFNKITSKSTHIAEKTANEIGDNVERALKNDFTRSPKSDVVITNCTSPINPSKIVNGALKAKREFCNNFLAKNPQIENVIKKANIEAFGQNGLPLKYSRKEFICDFNNIIKDLEPESKNELSQKLGMTAQFDKQGTFFSYEGFPTLDNLDSENPIHQQISNIINKFTQENEVVTNDPALNKTMNSVLKAFPEYVNVIGKKQHSDTQLYSVDVHIMKVLKEAMNNPEYEKLSDKDKTVMKMAILFHDIAKIEDKVDKGHQNVSAVLTKDLIKRINMPVEMKDRIFELVKNHHWLEEYNLDLTRPENIGKTRATPENIASRFRNPEDYAIAKIFAEADLKGVNNGFYEKYGGALSEERQAPIAQALKNINNSGNVIMTSRIVTPSRIPEINYSDKTYKVLNLTEMADAQDMEKYGFVRGTKKEDLRFLAHFLPDSSSEEMLESANAVSALSDVDKGGVFSASLASTKYKRSMLDRQSGLVLNTQNSNLAAALNRDMDSGFKKKFDHFSEYLHCELPSRAFLNENIMGTLSGKSQHLNYNEYGELFKKIMDKKYITQIKDVMIGKKIINGDDLKSAITKSQDELFTGGTGQCDYNEVVAYNPKISAVICKVDSIKKVPPVMLDFAHSKNLPIVLIGE